MKTLFAGALIAVLAATAGTGGAAETNAAPVWADTAPLTKQNVVLALAGGASARIDVLGPRLFRVRHSKTGKWTESALNRYGVLASSYPETAFQRPLRYANTSVNLTTAISFPDLSRT